MCWHILVLAARTEPGLNRCRQGSLRVALSALCWQLPARVCQGFGLSCLLSISGRKGLTWGESTTYDTGRATDALYSEHDQHTMAGSLLRNTQITCVWCRGFSTSFLKEETRRTILSLNLYYCFHCCTRSILSSRRVADGPNVAGRALRSSFHSRCQSLLEPSFVGVPGKLPLRFLFGSE